MWGRLAWLGRLFRTSEWYDTKLPLLLLVAYQSLLAGHSGAVGAGMLARAALYGAALLAFGYLINDLADTAVDRMAGKRRAMDGIARWLAWLICGIVAAVAALALRPSWGRPLVLILLALSLGLAAAYSLPPLRLKERGWLGLLTAAAAQRTVPGLTVAAFLGHLDWGIAWMGAIFLLMGLRYILLHQIMDAEHDRCARVRTYALAVGSVARLAATLNRIYLLELAALAALPFILGPACWWLG
ncbi:MAG TPA: UbiA family prenyltransferase, partial [Anaerolineae bacterium]|nr:UbiA family prenyltransferase [Anaerolineae bacterium]